MNVYTTKELEAIKKLSEKNDRLEQFFSDKRQKWAEDLAPLFEVVKLKVDTNTSTRITDTQSYALSYRQRINEEISEFLTRRSKQDVRVKKLKQDKFIFYATGFGVKTNYGEKQILIEGHISEEIRNMELIENYIEFLRSMNKNLESLQYTFKNIIELYNLLSRN